MKTKYKLWNQLPYAGEKKPPSNPEEPLSGSWPMIYLIPNQGGALTDRNGRIVKLKIKNPNTIDFKHELKIVQNTLKTLSPQQIRIAKYWGTGVASKQWTPIIDRLIDTYNVSPPKAARILSAVNSCIYDTFIITWFLKFRWLVPRPNQLDRRLATIICTPRHPAYPSGHSSISGAASVILSYFFPTESERLKDLAEECALSRLYGGVHFMVDNNEGLRLGRQIGKIIVNTLKKQTYLGLDPIDIPVLNSRRAALPPPPYKQVIPFDFDFSCQSKVRG